MNKEKFLDILAESLRGEVSEHSIQENIQYYTQYISEEEKKGKKEEDILEMLGDPRLIARTIIETSTNDKREENIFSRESYEEGYEEGESNKKGFHADFDQQSGWDIGYGRFRFNSWYGKLAIILVAILVLFIIGKVMAFLLPIIIPVLIIGFIISSMRRR